jgi:protein ImuA
MPALPPPSLRPDRGQLAALRAQVASAGAVSAPVLSFGIAELDGRLADGGLHGAGLHEIAAASAALSDDAAATLFTTGIAARFSRLAGLTTLWALTRFDLYAPGIAQAGLAPGQVFYAQGGKDSDVLALAEDGLRDGSLACVIAEVKSADQTATRRLQLAASDGRTPMLLYRRHRSVDRCPFATPSAAMTRWRIACLPSAPLPAAGLGRGRWSVELVRQRGGNPFTLDLEACDDTGRLALPAAAPDRATATAGTTSQAA